MEKPIDIPALQAMYDEATDEILAVFQTENDQNLKLLLSAHSNQDLAEVAIIAYKMKGSALIIQNQYLADLLGKVELHATGGKTLPADIESIQSSYQEISRFVADYLNGKR